MRIEGTRVLGAPRAAVFEAINDPEVLLACIPGCESVERTSSADYLARLSIVLPAVGGRFRLEVRVVEANPPASCRLDARLEGRPGTISGQAMLDLVEAPAGTRLDYRADARLDGPIAWLDTSLVERLARSVIEQGLDRLDRDLARRPAAVDTTAGA